MPVGHKQIDRYSPLLVAQVAPGHDCVGAHVEMPLAMPAPVRQRRTFLVLRDPIEANATRAVEILQVTTPTGVLEPEFGLAFICEKTGKVDHRQTFPM